MRDHPRVCGEEYQRGGLDAAQKGSPPRMRGREGQPGRVERGTGITPAYAGKSRPAVIIAGHFRDHPRVCGEEIGITAVVCGHKGSPPRMRGRVKQLYVLMMLRGITPAYAGKSTKDRGQAPGHRDHPRVCGEESGQALTRCARPGSPPRMRGRVGWSAERSGPEGITPAYAGKSYVFWPSPARSWDHPRVCGEESPSSLPSR